MVAMIVMMMMMARVRNMIAAAVDDGCGCAVLVVCVLQASVSCVPSIHCHRGHEDDDNTHDSAAEAVAQ